MELKRGRITTMKCLRCNTHWDCDIAETLIDEYAFATGIMTCETCDKAMQLVLERLEDLMVLEIKKAVYRIIELEYILDYKGEYDEAKFNETASNIYSKLLDRIKENGLESTARSVFHWVSNVILDTNDPVLNDVWVVMERYGDKLAYFMD